jgi:RecB family exonuclease
MKSSPGYLGQRAAGQKKKTMYRKAEMLERIQLRQSTIKDWLSCPLMFRFRHVEGISPAYRNVAALHGSALHGAIHQLHTLGFETDLMKLYRGAFRDAMTREKGIPIHWKESKQAEMDILEKHAVEILTGYCNWEENHLCQVLYSEVQFKVKIGGFELTGTIDQVRKNSDGELDLVDLKSGMQRPRAISLRSDWQLSLYAYALKYGRLIINGSEVRIPVSVDRAVIYHLRAHELYKRNSKYGRQGFEKGRPFIVCQKSAWDHQQFKHDFLNIVKMMTKDWPFPNPSACGYCAYQDICQDRTLLHASPQLRRVKADLDELGMLNGFRKG